MITYDSNSQPSQPDSSSSDSQTQPQLTKQQKTTRKQDKRLKNAIAYKFHEKKQQQHMKNIFENWKDLYMLTYRSQMYEAIKHYDHKLMEKGFDGIVQYATISGMFKHRLVVFYYRLLIHKYFRGWVELYTDRQLADRAEDHGSDVSLSINEINKNLDSIFKNSKQSFFSETIQERPKMKQQQKKKKVTKIQKGVEQLQNAQQHIKLNRLMVGFRSIQSYIKISMMAQRPLNSKTTSRNYVETQQKQQQEQRQYEEDQINFHNKTDINFTNKIQRNTVYKAQAHERNNQSREQSSMINSRRSAATIYQDFSEVKPSRSRRKLAPIMEKVQLPKFQRQQQNDPTARQVKQEKKTQSEQINDKSSNLRKKEVQRPEPSLKISQGPIKMMRSKLQMEEKSKKIQQREEVSQQDIKESKQEKEKQDEKQKMSQKQASRNKTLSLLTRGKLLQLQLINEKPQKNSAALTKLKQQAIDFLQKIKVL